MSEQYIRSLKERILLGRQAGCIDRVDRSTGELELELRSWLPSHARSKDMKIKGELHGRWSACCACATTVSGKIDAASPPVLAVARTSVLEIWNRRPLIPNRGQSRRISILIMTHFGKVSTSKYCERSNPAGFNKTEQ